VDKAPSLQSIAVEPTLIDVAQPSTSHDESEEGILHRYCASRRRPEGRALHSIVEGAADAEPPEADGAGPIEDGNVVGTAGGDSRSL
jgi:hypothetical protein